MREVYLEGMLLQASLIFALGPQNLFVLESGLKRHYHLTVSFVCFFCDLTLIMLGVAGAATFFNQFPQIKIIVGLLGVLFLILYGVGKLKHDDQEHLQFENNGKRTCYKAAIVSAVVFSVVNPHAYLDGIVLIGGYSSKYTDLSTRLALGLGAASFSLIWFLLLSVGASVMVPFFKSEKRMRFIMSSAGIILIIMSAKLGMDVFTWIEEVYPDTLASFGKGES
ncbi:MAG: LysE/ArgO family amino acid transporter [Bacteriovoracia bacterium]